MEFTGERFLSELDSPEISYSHWHRYLYATQFVEGKAVLDVACGEGYGSNLMAQGAQSVIGIDRDLETIRHATARYRGENLSFAVGSVSDIPIRGERVFDRIVSFETIEHVSEETQRAFLAEVKRLLKREGIFIVSTPNRLFCGDNPMFENEFHAREFYENEFRELLSHHFKHVVLLGHNLYSGSFIWVPEQAMTEIVEWNLDLSESGFRPAEDGKCLLYMVAVCSDFEIQAPMPSMLLDVSQRVYKLRLQDSARIQEMEKGIASLQADLSEKEQLRLQDSARIQEMEKGIKAFQTGLSEKEQMIKGLEEQLDAIYTSRGWKVLSTYYKIRDTLLNRKKE